MKKTAHKRILFVTIFFLLFTFLLANTATAQDPRPPKKFPGPDTENAQFGRSIAISDTVMVVGAPHLGEAYVFTRTDEGWDDGYLLTVEGAIAGDRGFGHSVSVGGGGNIVVVGAPGAKSAYVFTNDESGWDRGEELVSPIPAPKDNFFGWSVATCGNLVVVGTFAGSAAYVFTNDGTKWDDGETLPFSGTALFGFSLATDGMRIVVGDPSAGSAYVFTDDGSGWSQEGVLSVPVAAWFGSSVSISDDTVAVGAPSNLPLNLSARPPTGSGSAYVFAYDQDTSRWNPTPQDTLPSEAPGSGFGTSVSISDDLLAVSAPFDTVEDPPISAGAVYLFKKEVNGNETNWVPFEEQPKVTASDGNFPDAMVDDRFGWAVSLDGNTLAVGSPWRDDAEDGTNDTGAAYVYTLLPSNEPPTAVAYADPEKAKEDEQVFLKGSDSKDPDGDPLKLEYLWEQIETGGPHVELFDRTEPTAYFFAPELTNGCETLTFQLTVTDDKGEPSKPAEVQVKVRPNNTIYASLGGKRRHWLYLHKYTFEGVRDQVVTLELKADQDGWHRGSKATLILKDNIKGYRLFKTNRGSLPNTINATLPADGKYTVYVVKQPWFWCWWRHKRHKRFEGDYILTLEGDICGKLVPGFKCNKR